LHAGTGAQADHSGYAGASIPPEAMVCSPQDGRMGPPIFDYNAP